MHAKWNVNANLRQILWYHERKVSQEKAECLSAVNMIKEAEDLTLKEKRFYLERVQSLNQRVEKNTVHIFISWPKDDVLNNELMRKISQEYMKEMGMEEQPYLVYRHRDAAHAHVHVVSSLIRSDGTRYNYWAGSRFQSYELSRKLEQKYHLHQAGKLLPDEEWARLHPAQKVVHGVTPLKSTMNTVLEAVVPKYVYTSLEELNVLLRSYNLKAIRGQEKSITYRNNGLLYVTLDGAGKVEQGYVKSSDLRCRPTLKHLKQRFDENRTVHEASRQRVKTAIDWIFFKQAVSREVFQQALHKEKIGIVMGEGKRVYYMDQLNKAVIGGDGLGHKYSAVGIQERCIAAEEYRQQQQQQKQVQQQKQGVRQRPRMDLY